MNNKSIGYFFNPKIIEKFNPYLYFQKEDVDKVKKNNKKFMMSDKGIYSISKPEHAEWITKSIFETIPNCKDLIITDSTSGIGGDTISFSKYFRHVNALEINDIHYKILKNNINVLNLKNVSLCNCDYVTVGLEKFSEDIVFMDPPWGGKKYHLIKFFNMRLGDIPIQNIINKVRSKGTKYFVLKAPYNINITIIVRDVFYNKCKIIKNQNIWLIIFWD